MAHLCVVAQICAFIKRSPFNPIGIVHTGREILGQGNDALGHGVARGALIAWTCLYVVVLYFGIVAADLTGRAADVFCLRCLPIGCNTGDNKLVGTLERIAVGIAHGQRIGDGMRSGICCDGSCFFGSGYRRCCLIYLIPAIFYAAGKPVCNLNFYGQPGFIFYIGILAAELDFIRHCAGIVKDHEVVHTQVLPGGLEGIILKGSCGIGRCRSQLIPACIVRCKLGFGIGGFLPCYLSGCHIIPGFGEAGDFGTGCTAVWRRTLFIAGFKPL